MVVSYPKPDLAIEDAALLQGRAVALIDIRFPQEAALFGPLPGAHNLPLSRLQRFTGAPVQPDCEVFSHRDLDPGERRDLTRVLVAYAAARATLLCVCRNGERSAVAACLLRDLGYGRAMSLRGGLSVWDGWIRQRFVPPRRATPGPGGTTPSPSTTPA